MDKKGLKFDDIGEKILQEIIEEYIIQEKLLVCSLLSKIVKNYNLGFQNFQEIKKTENYIKQQSGL